MNGQQRKGRNQQKMFLEIVQEIHVGRIAQNNDIGIKVITNSGKEIDLHLPRDIAINLITQIHVALDIRGAHTLVDLH